MACWLATEVDHIQPLTRWVERNTTMAICRAYAIHAMPRKLGLTRENMVGGLPESETAQ
jgi:hypothetical protein